VDYVPSQGSGTYKISPLEIKEVLFKRGITWRYQGGIFFLWYFLSVRQLLGWDTTKTVLCCRKLALRELPPGSGVLLPPFSGLLLLPGVRERAW